MPNARGAHAADKHAANRLRIRIEPSDRVFVCGQTGSGKSFLARRLLAGVKAPLLIIDIKTSFEFPKAKIVEKLRDLEQAFRRGERRVLFRPALMDWDSIDAAFSLAYRRGGTTVYNDERGGWGRLWETNLLPAEAHAVMRGRSRNVAVWTGTQRPSRIPIALLSEAEHFFVMRLQNGDDRKKVSTFAGDPIAKDPIPKRWYWYSGPDTDGPILRPPIPEKG